MSSNNKNTQSQHKDLVFFVRIQYRCNSSWQGSIQWMDGKQQTIFRSALELGNLINDAKQRKSSGSEHKNKLKKWDDKEEVS